MASEQHAAAMVADMGLVELYEHAAEVMSAILSTETARYDGDTLLEAARLHEQVMNIGAAAGNQRIIDLTDNNVAAEKGFPRIRDFLTSELHIPDASRRLTHAQNLQSLYGLTGEKLPPVCPNLAEAAADGAAAPAHIDAALKVLDKVPAKVDADSRAAAEEMMAQFAREYSPADITKLGTRLLAHLDPDGTITDDADRQRRRKLTLAPQDADLMSNLAGCLDPITRAMFDVVLAAWAAPGMNNPDDDDPLIGSHEQHSAEAVKDAKQRDLRSPSQRNHDALKALLKAALDGELLGKSHRGLPPHLVISITEAELRERAGLGQTTTGALLPMSDVVELAAQAQQHLAVFSGHSTSEMYYGRAERLASQEQRFMLFAIYGGCSYPGCTAPFAHTEIHHTPDYADGGLTDISDMAPACGPHNRIVTNAPGGWSTALITHGNNAGYIGWQRNPPDGNPTSSKPAASKPAGTTDTASVLRTNMIHRFGVILTRYICEQRERRARENSVDPSADDPP